MSMNNGMCFSDAIAHFNLNFSFKTIVEDIILFNTRYFVFLLFLGLAEMKYKVTNYGNLRVFVEAGFRLLKIRIQNRKFTGNYERSLQ